MKILKSEVEWYEGYANEPKLRVWVDEMPDSDDFVYTSKKVDSGNELFFAKHPSGLVSFYCHNPQNEGGYGRSTFILKMDDGTKRSIRGPWSSRCGVMNHYFDHSVEVILHVGDDEYGAYSGALTIERANEAALMAGVKLEEVLKRDDICYEVVQLDGDDVIALHCGDNFSREDRS